MKQSIISKITEGRLSLQATQLLAAFIKANDGKQVAIEMKAYKKRRSSQQNRHYFGCVVPAVHNALTERGEIVSPEAVHEYLKRYVGGFQVRVLGEWVTKSSAELTTHEWSEWLDKICAWGALNGIYIPLPNEGE